MAQDFGPLNKNFTRRRLFFTRQWRVGDRSFSSTSQRQIFVALVFAVSMVALRLGDTREIKQNAVPNLTPEVRLITRSPVCFLSVSDYIFISYDWPHSSCVSRCWKLSPKGSYGLPTPIFEGQYIGAHDFTLGYALKEWPLWLGLMYNGSVAWNRYSVNQTVHSLPRIQEWMVTSPYTLPVYYHHNGLWVDPHRKLATCVCEKG